MNTFAFSRYAFSIGVAAALLAGCGASQLPSERSPSGAAPPIGVKLAFPNRVDKAPNYRVLYDFGAPPDGSGPDAGLIDVGGTLYGTTAGGGAYSSYTARRKMGVSTGTSAGTMSAVVRSSALRPPATKKCCTASAETTESTGAFPWRTWST